MAKTARGSLSRGLEFEIIGDYTHPSPFLKKRREICLIPSLVQRRRAPRDGWHPSQS